MLNKNDFNLAKNIMAKKLTKKQIAINEYIDAENKLNAYRGVYYSEYDIHGIQNFKSYSIDYINKSTQRLLDLMNEPIPEPTQKQIDLLNKLIKKDYEYRKESFEGKNFNRFQISRMIDILIYGNNLVNSIMSCKEEFDQLEEDIDNQLALVYSTNQTNDMK